LICDLRFRRSPYLGHVNPKEEGGGWVAHGAEHALEEHYCEAVVK
jgi:hypothetical protein